MNELDQLIKKFWNGQTTSEEDRRLYTLLQDQQEMTLENRSEDLLPTAGEKGKLMDDETSKRLLGDIHERIGHVPPKAIIIPINRLLRRLAVAAVVVVIAGCFWLSLRPTKTKEIIAKKTNYQGPRVIRENNQSDTSSIMNLPDGSMVKLEPGSAITYYYPFPANRRDIYLTGEGFFKVAHDKSMPFTVYACNIGTTALGTQFVVNARDSSKVMVKLLEGKVVIRPVAGADLALQDVYLNAGQVFFINIRNSLASVESFGNKSRPRASFASGVAKKGIIFNKEPLDKVFIRISQAYNVPVSFEKEQLKGLYFTGTFLSSDDLQMVLSSICNVNDLRFVNRTDTVVIKRFN